MENIEFNATTLNYMEGTEDVIRSVFAIIEQGMDLKANFIIIQIENDKIIVSLDAIA